MNEQEIVIKRNKAFLKYTYEDVLAYHGGEMPGGVALAFRMIQWVFEDVLKVEIEHGNCSFYSGLGKNGRGIMDTAKLLLGVVENDSLNLDIEYSLDKTGPIAPGGGRYYFEVACGEKKAKLSVRDGVIPKSFFEYSAKMHRKRSRGEVISKQEKEELQRLRKEISYHILKAGREEIFQIIE